MSSFQTESELQELIREVEENPAPPDAPQPPTPKAGDTESGNKEITGLFYKRRLFLFLHQKGVII